MSDVKNEFKKNNNCDNSLKMKTLVIFFTYFPMLFSIDNFDQMNEFI